MYNTYVRIIIIFYDYSLDPSGLPEENIFSRAQNEIFYRFLRSIGFGARFYVLLRGIEEISRCLKNNYRLPFLMC